MIMDYLGPNLQQLLDYCNGKFSLKTVCMIAREAILRIEMMHKMGYVHRDIKPDNFVIGLGEKANLLYLIDLGLCKRYWNPTTNTHIMFVQGSAPNILGILRIRASLELLVMLVLAIIQALSRVGGMIWNLWVMF